MTFGEHLVSGHTGTDLFEHYKYEQNDAREGSALMSERKLLWICLHIGTQTYILSQVYTHTHTLSRVPEYRLLRIPKFQQIGH